MSVKGSFPSPAASVKGVWAKSGGNAAPHFFPPKEIPPHIKCDTPFIPPLGVLLPSQALLKSLTPAKGLEADPPPI